MAVDKTPGFYKYKLYENLTLTTNKIYMPFLYFVLNFFFFYFKTTGKYHRKNAYYVISYNKHWITSAKRNNDSVTYLIQL